MGLFSLILRFRPTDSSSILFFQDSRKHVKGVLISIPKNVTPISPCLYAISKETTVWSNTGKATALTGLLPEKVVLANGL